MVDSSPINAGSYPTRTLAIIKPHALPHRLDIERRITEAGFEIAKERQMMFRERDRDVEELFGVNNAVSLAEGPCWVYVLERRRAVEVLKTLMGDEDPEIARQSNANSLRALYGTSLDDNALIGSPDTATAEHQISILFASSPPFRTTELPSSPSFAGQTGSLRSITSSILSALNQENGEGFPGFAPSNSQSPVSGTASTAGRSSKARSTGSGFRARPVPSTNATPSVQPRLSRAAALRAGIVQPVVSIWHEGPRQAISKEEHQRTFANVPGHKRADTITVASTAPPVVAPRMTRA
ncbi:nucleoside diphosphate kinase, partial [Ramaria rubella]